LTTIQNHPTDITVQLHEPCIARDSLGGLHTVFIPNLFPEQFCEVIFTAFKFYKNFKTSAHGIGNRYFGVHCDSSTRPIISSDIYRCLSYFTYLLPLHAHLGQVVDALNRELKFPGNILNKMNTLAPAWKFLGRTISSQWLNDLESSANNNSKKKVNIGAHKDFKNLPNSLTWVFVFGNFSGGEVTLKNTRQKLFIKNGGAYAFRADIDDHSVEDIIGERVSLVNFTHASLLQIPENAHIYQDLDPWLTHEIHLQNPKFSSFDFQSQQNWSCKEKLDYVISQSEKYHTHIQNKKKEIN